MYFKVLFFLFFIILISPGLDFFYYIFGISLETFKKVSFNGMLVCALLYQLNKNIYITFESLLFLVFSILTLCLGFYYHGIVKYSLLHIYATIIPIFMISFGIHFYRSCTTDILNFLQKLLIYALVINLIFLALYIVFHHLLDIWGYYGFGTSLALLSAYILSQNRHALFLFVFLIDIFSGKRSSFVGMIFLFLINRGFFISDLTKRNLLMASIFPLILIYLFINIDSFEFLRRFAFLRDVDLEDGVSIMLATGGRATEVISIIEWIDGDIVKWLLGSGIGASYDYIDPRLQFSVEKLHYAHFSPFSYILVYGSIFTFLLYCTFFYRLYSGFNYKNNYFYLSFAFLFFSSFFGSILFVNPMPWFFLGVVIEMTKNPRNEIQFKNQL